MKVMRVLMPVVLLLTSTFLSKGQTNWKPYSSELSFKIKNAGATVTGRFQGLKANLNFSPDKLASSSLKGTVDVATIKTGINKRDKDLLQDKYFNEDKYKQIEISSTKLYKKGNQYAGTFNVTIKGVTRQMEIPFEFTGTDKDATFTSTFELNRRDFGVGDKSIMMSDKLTVSLIVKAKN